MRLDTYSGAPVDFAAYEADPAAVVIAGAARARPFDTAHRTPVARWRFTPPPGPHYTPNDVEVPLEGREGFFVIEARRGQAVQQTWLDVTRVGLLTKESPAGILLYGADLRTGRALANMRIVWLAGTAFRFGVTDARGLARWTDAARPRFAVAQWGRSRTFVALLPQPPTPAALVGLRLERAAVRAGERVRAVGFARSRAGAIYRPASGDVRLTLVARAKTLAVTTARLDAAGAFAAELPIPAGARAGEAAVLASAAGASAGAALRIDAVSDLTVSVAASCEPSCAADAAVPLAVSVRRSDGTPAAGRDVRIRVVRSPHIAPPEVDADAPSWGTTTALDVHARTDAAGVAHASVAAPTDALASTLTAEATSGAASGSTRIVLPTAPIALDIVPERERLDPGRAAILDVRGFDAVDGRPTAGLSVRVQLVHGPIAQEQTLTLDGEGRARAVFRGVVPGTSIAF
ncbi:MAG: hypothetical protein JOZ24_07565, partial [Candidatus Eremiobacteraeota bacterium]|nr:hypothetical protein [Candidatus Eremiobacteraeota bacterium]